MRIQIFDDADRLIFESPQRAFTSADAQAATDAVLQALPSDPDGGSDLGADATADVSFAVQPVTPNLGTQNDLAAAIFNALGRAYLNAGHTQVGRRLVERAAELRTRLFDPNHPAMAESLQMLARVQRDEGNQVEAEALIRQALAIQTKLGGITGLSAIPLLWELSVIQTFRFQLDDAEQTVLEALRIIERYGFEGTDPYMTRLWQILGRVHLGRGDYAKVIEVLGWARDRAALQQGAESFEYASVTNEIGVAQAELGQIAEGEAKIREAIRINEAVNNKHPNLSAMYVNLARVLEQKGPEFRAEARQACTRAMAVSACTRGKDHPYYAFDQANLAALEFGSGNLTAAHTLFQEALSTFRRRAELSKAHTGAALLSLARIYLESHAPESSSSRPVSVEDPLRRALDSAQEAVEIFKHERGDGSVEHAYSCAVLGRAKYLSTPRSNEARALLADSHRILVDKCGAGSRYAETVSKWIRDTTGAA